ncbi:DUF397 domain-containing protein [Streptomyces sp. NPDC051561]|uniref:DUF397 domain-containing protein n=1 Tax=Streptomyces sp. NPDC051561 TaxID=3365658 RepID=UPI0037914F2F
MTTTTESPRWLKSSYSDNGGNCVEVAANLAVSGLVPVRDSKTPDGPILAPSCASWVAFVGAVQADSL